MICLLSLQLTAVCLLTHHLRMTFMNSEEHRHSATGTILHSLRRADLFTRIGLICLLGVLSACGPAGTTSRTGSDDEMAITSTETGYRVTLDEVECLDFRLPELNGIGQPRVSVKAVEDGWQRVSLRWEVPGEIARFLVGAPSGSGRGVRCRAARLPFTRPARPAG